MARERLPDSEVEAMRAMGARWLDEVRAYALAEAEVHEPGANLSFRQTCKVLDCLFMAQVKTAELPNIFSAFGMVLGAVYGQQDAFMKALLDDALERGLSVGMDRAAADHPQMGRA
jgi:hypothetical protein